MSTYTPISTQTLTSAAASVTFTGIPQNYTDLVLIVTGTRNSASLDLLRYQFNGDAGTNYSRTFIIGNGSTASSSRSTNQTFGYAGDMSNSVISNHIIHFMNYSNTTTFKTVLTRGNKSDAYTEAEVNLWRNTAAINSIFLSPGGVNFNADCTFTLYGIGSGSPKAFGGNIVTTDGTYWYHTFNTSGIFSPMTNLANVDYLVVAGGGGGGSSGSNSNGPGGGGAGGFRTSAGTSGGGASAESKLSLNQGFNYTVVVGAGGVGGLTTNSTGAKGSNSIFSTITSIGGGGAAPAAYTAINGIGGSGSGSHGGVDGVDTGNNETSGQGFRGGYRDATNAIGSGGGGGGGAGAVGATATNNSKVGGAGGAGVASSISGTSVTYAGGGGGGGTTAGGAGGSGGGSAGEAGTNATANTGGGGGGNFNGTAGAGGSGIVIVRYAV
jgi:hypothetical protein